MFSHEVKQSTKKLKHLGFMKEFAVKVLVILSNVYDFAKENSGKLKTVVAATETIVVSITRPLYAKLKDLTEQIIEVVDEKFEKYAPTHAKNLLAKFESLISKATPLLDLLVNTTKFLKKIHLLEMVSSAIQTFVKSAKVVGVKAALQSTYMSFKLVGLPLIAELWYKGSKYPLFHKFSDAFLPVAEKISKWYNKVVKYMDGKGYKVFGYLPSVPIDEMKVAYKLVKTTMDGLSAAGNLIHRMSGKHN